MGGNAVVRVAYAAVFLVVAYLAATPLIMVLISAFGAHQDHLPLESIQVGLANFTHMLADPSMGSLIGNTALFTIGSVLIGVGGAALFAWLIERSDLPCRQLIFVLLLAPMVIPNMVYAMAWLQLLNPNNGMLNAALQAVGLGWIHLNGYSMPAMIFVEGVLLMSQAYLLIAAPFRMIDPSWEEQSEICGKSKLITVLRITLPILKPALFALVALFTVVGIETFDIPGTMGLPANIHLFSTRIYGATHPDGGALPDYGSAGALATVLVVIAYFLIAMYRRQTRNARQFVTITGRAFRAKRTSLGPWRIPIFLFALGVLTFTIVLPVAMLIWRSLIPFYVHPWLAKASLISLNAYRTFVENDVLSAVYNTGQVVLFVGLVSCGLAAAIAWFTVRAPVGAGARAALSGIALLPQAVPSVVIGLAVMFLYLYLPIGIYGTIWIISVALITKYLSYATASMLAAQMQISPELEEAAQLSGSGFLRTYRRITVPLLTPAFMSCLLWVCVQAIRELGAAIMLYSQQSQVLSTKVWNLWEGGYVGQACAVGVATVVVLLALLSLPHAYRALRFATRLLIGRPILQRSLP
jgi:iron(III) transport system permease protein